MHCLNTRAYDLLAKEVKRLTEGISEAVRRDIILRRLNKLRVQQGAPLTYVELEDRD